MKGVGGILYTYGIFIFLRIRADGSMQDLLILFKAPSNTALPRLADRRTSICPQSVSQRICLMTYLSHDLLVS